LEGSAAHGDGTAEKNGFTASGSGGGAAERHKTEFIAEDCSW